MRVELSLLFEETLFNILEYIENESPHASIRFEEALLEHLENLIHFPYKFRKSIYHDDEHIRDYIFMGYTIPYLVDEKNDMIVVLDIFKWVEK